MVEGTRATVTTMDLSSSSMDLLSPLDGKGCGRAAAPHAGEGDDAQHVPLLVEGKPRAAGWGRGRSAPLTGRPPPPPSAAAGGVDEGAVAAVGQGRVDEGTTTSAMEEGAVSGREESSSGGPQPPHALLLLDE